MDEAGNTIPGPNNNEIHSLGMNTSERISALCAGLGWFAFYSMMRTSVLKRIKLAFNTGVFGADVILEEELSLLGPFILLPEVLFNYRMVQSSVSQDLANNKNGKPPTLYSDLGRNLLDFIEHTDLSEADKSDVRQNLLKTICYKNKIWNNLLLQENHAFFNESIQNCKISGSPNAEEVDQMFRKILLETPIERPEFEGYQLTDCIPVSSPPFGFNLIHDSMSLEDNVVLRTDIQLLQELMYPVSLINLNDLVTVEQCQMPYAVNLYYVENHVKFASSAPKLLLKSRLNVLVGAKANACVQFDDYSEQLSAGDCKNYYYRFNYKCSGRSYPSLATFVSTTTELVEKGKFKDALAYYYESREFYPTDKTLSEFDALMLKLKSKI
jgi:hypothetical protein